MKQEPRDEDEATHGGNITLNATAEFCRTLGDIPTYGLAGNRDEDAEELMVMFKTLMWALNKLLSKQLSNFISIR
jgi:hypothetical protein